MNDNQRFERTNYDMSLFRNNIEELANFIIIDYIMVLHYKHLLLFFQLRAIKKNLLK